MIEVYEEDVVSDSAGVAPSDVTVTALEPSRDAHTQRWPLEVRVRGFSTEVVAEIVGHKDHDGRVYLFDVSWYFVTLGLVSPTESLFEYAERRPRPPVLLVDDPHSHDTLFATHVDYVVEVVAAYLNDKIAERAAK
jgi:hypothetical protein